MSLQLPDDAIALLKPLFLAVEGTCEAWTDDEVGRRILIRGAMEYAKSAGRSWEETLAVASELRAILSDT